jgi:type II secretory pathway component PulC
MYPRTITNRATNPEGSKRFRLAGIYSIWNPDGKLDKRYAILDDISRKQQHLVKENDKIGDIEILNIFDNKLILRTPGGIEEIPLTASSAETVAKTQKEVEDAYRPTSKYGGKRLGEFSWTFQRQNLVDYYKELLSDPARLVKVFDSMQPVRDELGKITGYKLKILGEREFFDAVGLKEGDVIREVNSMPMTSRKLSEYYIGEFIKGRANSFVLGIERGGKVQKHVYQIRD